MEYGSHGVDHQMARVAWAHLMKSPTIINGDPPPDTRLQRALLGLSAIVLATLGAILQFVPSLEPGGTTFLSGMLWKVSIVLALAWVAAPQLERLGWQRVRGALLIGIIIVVILYAIRPRLGAIAVVVLIAASTLTTILSWVRKFTN